MGISPLLFACGQKQDAAGTLDYSSLITAHWLLNAK